MTDQNAAFDSGANSAATQLRLIAEGVLNTEFGSDEMKTATQAIQTLHGQLRQEREGQRNQKARLLDLRLKWDAEQAEYPDTEVGRHAAALLRLCVRELYDALSAQAEATPDSGGGA